MRALRGAFVVVVARQDKGVDETLREALEQANRFVCLGSGRQSVDQRRWLANVVVVNVARREPNSIAQRRQRAL